MINKSLAADWALTREMWAPAILITAGIFNALSGSGLSDAEIAEQVELRERTEASAESIKTFLSGDFEPFKEGAKEAGLALIEDANNFVCKHVDSADLDSDDALFYCSRVVASPDSGPE